MDLLVTPEEEIMMRKDYDAASEAGIDINNVKCNLLDLKQDSALSCLTNITLDLGLQAPYLQTLTSPQFRNLQHLL